LPQIIRVIPLGPRGRGRGIFLEYGGPGTRRRRPELKGRTLACGPTRGALHADEELEAARCSISPGGPCVSGLFARPCRNPRAGGRKKLGYGGTRQVIEGNDGRVGRPDTAKALAARGPGRGIQACRIVAGPISGGRLGGSGGCGGRGSYSTWWRDRGRRHIPRQGQGARSPVGHARGGGLWAAELVRGVPHVSNVIDSSVHFLRRRHAFRTRRVVGLGKAPLRGAWQANHQSRLPRLGLLAGGLVAGFCFRFVLNSHLVGRQRGRRVGRTALRDPEQRRC